jgi:hypothetical protein
LLLIPHAPIFDFAQRNTFGIPIVETEKAHTIAPFFPKAQNWPDTVFKTDKIKEQKIKAFFLFFKGVVS